LSVRECVVITGMSGAGKSVLLRALEDEGYYAIDNLPPRLLPQLLEVLGHHPAASSFGVCAVMDVRGGELLEEFLEVRDRVSRSVPVRVVFLEASPGALIKRYQETRRRHPLDGRFSLEEAIEMEREILAPIKAIADEVVDTTSLSSKDLRAAARRMAGSIPNRSPSVLLVSFGFRWGLPPDADMVLDVRFLSNPYYREDLRDRDGRDPQVRAFFEGQEEVGEVVRAYASLVEKLLPLYGREGKALVDVAVGCTGGRHRSVYVAEEMGRILRRRGFSCRVLHRDLERE